jgi:hypothetical protein
MKNIFLKHLVILAVCLSLQSNAKGDSLPTSTTSIQTATTINDFWTNAQCEELKMAGRYPKKPKSYSPNAQDLISMNYDALIQTCVSNIDNNLKDTGKQIKYIDGQVKFFLDGPSTMGMAFLGFLSLSGLGMGLFIFPSDQGYGFLAAKIALLTLGTAFGVCTAMAIRNRIKKQTEPCATFNREGLMYTTFDQSGATSGSKQLQWSRIKSVAVTRITAINIWDKHPYAIPTIESALVELKDESDKTLIQDTALLFPVEIPRFLELISFYRAQALSLPPDSLPITVTTEVKTLSEETSREIAYCDPRRTFYDQGLLN